MSHESGSKTTKPKNIVVCSDGTGNSANKDRGTNVFKLYEAIDLNGHLAPNTDLIEQIAFYDDGVGTESFKPARILGGAFGWGLGRNVRQLYASLVRSYNREDRIFLFGFSRGAFTARTLGGFITSCGILDREQYADDTDLKRAVNKAYEVYRSRYMVGFNQDIRRRFSRAPSTQESPGAARSAPRVAKFREQYAPLGARIAFIGVWDTVAAIGMPIDHLADFINYFIYPFKFGDQGLSGLVNRACQAIAIDDERHTFHPLMWDESDQDHERISQVWFSGVHSNVGGGYPKQGMSIVALDWMMSEAAKVGLRFNAADRTYFGEHVNINDMLYNSRAGLAVYYRYKPRDIAAICRAANTTPKVHESVIDRIRQQTAGYSPGNLPVSMTLVATGAATTRHPNAAATVTAAYGTASSPLERVQFQVRVRRLSHYVFLALSAALAGVLIIPQLSAERGIWSIVKAIFTLNENSLVQGFLLHPWLAGSLLALIGAFFALGLVTEERMARKFSAFWRQVIPKL